MYLLNAFTVLISLSYCEIPHKVSYSLITSLTSPPTILPLSGAFQMLFWLRAVAHAVPSSGNSYSRQWHESFLHLFSVFVLMSFSQWEAFSIWLTTVPHTHTLPIPLLCCCFPPKHLLLSSCQFPPHWTINSMKERVFVFILWCVLEQ